MPKIAVLLCLLLFLLLSPLTSIADDLTADETAVWQLEETYWEYVKAYDLDSYITLWDERFVGWPRSTPQPVEKNNITNWIPPLHADAARRFDFQLQREAVRGFGADIVVVHYLCKYVFRDATSGQVVEERPWLRFTHTWQRHGDSWQIITGMSASYDF